jgi:hypothetical protein
MNSKIQTSLYIILPILYAGILIGVSFIATPIKFMATSLDLPVALDVGHVTFHVLIRLEWCLSFICLAIFYFRALYKLDYTLIAIIFIILAIQTFYLLPILDDRIILIKQNKAVTSSNLHLVYILLDCIKLFSLLTVSYNGLQNMILLFSHGKKSNGLNNHIKE